MNARGLGVALLVAAAVGCGEGRAIFSVDIHSFLAGTGSDVLTLPPAPAPPLPPGLEVTATTTPAGVDLPTGMSSSLVDTVRLDGTLDITSPTSSGDLTYEVFFSTSSDSATVYSGAPALRIGPTSFPVTATTSVPIVAPNLAATVGDVFKGSALYVGIRGTIRNTGATGLETTLILTQLHARIVFQDAVF